VVPGLTLRVLPTSILTRRSAVKVKTCSVQRTLAVIDTFASGATDERIAPISSRTGADRSVGARSVKPSLTLSSRTAGVGSAQILLLKWSTAHKGIAGVAFGTGTDRLVVGGLTRGSLSAHVGVWIVAGVSALQSDTGLVAGAVVMSGALGVAAGVGIAQEVWGTGALGAVVDCLTIGVLSARSSAARILTPVVLSVALLSWSALVVSLALVSAALQRVADVCCLASADGSVVRSNLTVSVSSTWSTDLVSGESSATSERISSCPPGTSADGDMILHGAL